VNIEFAASAPKTPMVWVPPEVCAKLVREFGLNPASALNGRTICVRCRVEHYGGFLTEWKDRLQLTVQDAHDLWLVADDPASPATAP
jgi:hypothetical protein